jgi:hypothetical protein
VSHRTRSWKSKGRDPADRPGLPPSVLPGVRASVPLRDLDHPDAAETLALVYRQLTLAEDALRRGHPAAAERVARLVERLLRKLEIPNAPPALLLPDGDGAWIGLRRVDRKAVASWLYCIPLGLREEQLDRILSPGQSLVVRRVLEAFSVSYRAERAAAEAERSADDREHAVRLASAQRKILTGALEHGLRCRIGAPLAASDWPLYVHLVVRGIEAEGVRCCEDCGIVFEAPRASRCRACGRKPRIESQRPWDAPARRPPRLVRRVLIAAPHETGGTTVLANLSSPPFALDERCCEGCGARFNRRNAQHRFCAACGSGRTRTARSRAKEAGSEQLSTTSP